MGKMRIDWHPAGFEQLLRHPSVQADLERRAQAIADQAGDGYEVRTPTRRTRRARVAVITTTNEAKRDNARNLTLVKALGAGR